MLLQQLKLKNIRSYTEQTITFPEGSTLLAGDIGSGKSTILLAIEFALFGTSRPDLPGEALLRKGSTQGSVELTFQVDNKNIAIYRALKKEKDGIKQLPGYIIINNVKKDLMPVELKAEILQLLGYPEDYLTKNKNYIFRYTVYTPQEEMKLILQDDAEFRQDSLRKIFNIDKYKIIRENVEFYLKQMRMQMRSWEEQLVPLPQLQVQAQSLQEEQEKEKRSLQQATELLQSLQADLQKQRSLLEQWEKEQQNFLEWKRQQQTYMALVAEKNTQRQAILERQERLRMEMGNLLLPAGLTFEQVQEEKIFLEKKRATLLTTTTKLQEELKQEQRQLQQLQEEVAVLTKEIIKFPEKEIIVKQLASKAGRRGALEQRKTQFDDLLHKTVESISKNETLLQQAQELETKIKMLEQCPLCRQPVSEEHKQHVQQQEQHKIEQAENLLFEFRKKKVEIQQQREKLQVEVLQAIQEENLLTRTTLELEQLREKQQRLAQKEELQKRGEQAIQALQDQIKQLQQDEEQQQLEIKLQRGSELLQLFTKRQALEVQLRDLALQQEQVQIKWKEMQEKLALVEEKLRESKDQAALITEKKNLISQLQEQEKQFIGQQAHLRARQQGLQQQEQQLQQQITLLTELKQKLQRSRDIYNWLEGHFIKLTYTIEKHVMVSIHQLFNQLFQEWFSLLIEDEVVTSRLDDSFTPIIEQNGYEISFGNLSGGERTSAALAYRLALNKVINEVIQDIKTKDLLILDEPTDGFSSEQLDKVRDVLERLQLRQTIIVSHESKVESFVENVVRIRKEGQVSGVDN